MQAVSWNPEQSVAKQLTCIEAKQRRFAVQIMKNGKYNYTIEPAGKNGHQCMGITEQTIGKIA